MNPDNPCQRGSLAAALLLIAAQAQAAEAPASLTSSSLSLAGMLQMLFGLAVVLGLVLAMGWIMKRVSSHGLAGGAALRVVAAAAVGQRERVVVVEVGNTWLVVGVAPGSVNALHSMARGELPPAPAAQPAAATQLADWLQRTLERKNVR
ncbi:MAG: flagellar biosynthetic protein FliO [Burkholderiales bacterium]|nr:flagellar biosynthetic protein FliO [Burkholderiales bacterium]